MTPGGKALPHLAAELFELVDSFPPARAELVDFHFKSCVENYLDALHHAGGRKILVAAGSHADITASLRRLLLLADVVVVACEDAVAKSGLSFFPVPDDLKSPVLGLQAVMDENQKLRPPRPVEVAYLTTLLAQKAQEQQTSASILGVEWTPGGRGWQRTFYTRTSEPFRNAKGQACHIAAGIVHGGEPPLYDWLQAEAKHLLLSGHLVWAPFVFTAPNPSTVDEGAMKASLLQSTFVLNGSKLTAATGEIHPLTDLEIPYLENVPLPLLADILKDEAESLRSFRHEVDRAFEDITDSGDPAEVRRRVARFRRELLEDELDRVKQTCERLSRMNALSRIGAYVGTAAISIAGVLGLDPPSVICGAAGVATATVAELYRNYEEKRGLRRSPMHLVWRLERVAG